MKLMTRKSRHQKRLVRLFQTEPQSRQQLKSRGDNHRRTHKNVLKLKLGLDKNIDKIGKGSSHLLTLRTAVWRFMFTLLEAKTIKLLFRDR